MASRFDPPAVLQALVSGAVDDALFVVAAFVGGAIVGSFLNVVAHRVPAGRSVIAGRSACPVCGHAVRARDNVPILGWLMLGGRCRDCGSPISNHYPLVEAACGTALAAVMVGEIIAWRRTGSSLPLVERLAMLGDWRWLVGWLAKAAAVLTIVAWSLLARAGHAVSWRTVAGAALMVGGIAAAGSPSAAYRASIEAATAAFLLITARATLGSPAAPDERRRGGSRRWLWVGGICCLAVVGWTVAAPPLFDWLAGWFCTQSGP